MITPQDQDQERLLFLIEKALGRHLIPSVRQAFRCVPRTRFIEAYYKQRGNTLKWDEVTTPTVEEIYQDTALTTKIDDRGIPISSTSQPSVMAVQLEQLDVHPGHHILEIGAGTGWNAALLGTLVGPDGSVVSIDIDEDLVHTAKHHLQGHGYSPPVSVYVGNGFEGYPLGAHQLYDRILATCGLRSIPDPWIALLQDQGIIVANLLLNLASVFVRLSKTSDTVLTGHFFPLDASYMEMRPSVAKAIDRMQRTNWKEVDARPQRSINLSLPDTEDLPMMLADPACALLLQSVVPSITRVYQFGEKDNTFIPYFRLSPSSSVMIRVDRDHLTLYGNDNDESETFVHNLSKAIHRFLQLRPRLEDFEISWHQGNMSATLDHIEIFPLVVRN